ncbi:RnfABCDGE type electron transport complex subunit G [Flavivirga rizhaonensis]|uniref:Ion-translocating oxidoreductase complex subunit G n=1 Tax=Flavivirga rizhaonensis TaxID=2559571 RepID=A0A4S1DXA5_9FLAO|nr:RnfABCDGE type electron transport complex subunit G [Flavivirga rizhaonensis]TGV02142.1 RnfABCDGE type electron transport complex subunit G [Flavivirga rizhaonensis]
MSEVANMETQNLASSKKMLLAMVGIGIISALLIVTTFELTLPRVQRLKAEALEKAIFEVLPGTVNTQAFGVNANGELFKMKEGDKTETAIYAGYDNNDNIVGYAIEASGQGYADIIRILYGYEPDKETLIGFQVLESKETPGLGDKIEKEEHFLNNFKALDVSLSNNNKLQNKVITVKQGEKQNPWEIDGITGATISSRAIGNIIGTSTSELVPILYNHYKKNHQKPKESNEQ